MQMPISEISGVPPDHQLEETCSCRNKAIVAALYNALAKAQELETVSKLIATDLEWWFHGPPRCQHMMRVLTGDQSARGEFLFEPRSIEVVDGAADCVIAEGWEGKAYWVHVWILKDGLITTFREYFNTWLTVKGVKPHEAWEVGFGHHHSHTLWQSHPRDLYDRSLPGVLLAI